jgi:hypothetical protein
MSGGRMKGPISQIAGYGCIGVTDSSKVAIFMERDHSLCEEHIFKE